MENQSTHTLKPLLSWFPTFFTVPFLFSSQYLFLIPAFMLFLCFLSVAFPFLLSSLPAPSTCGDIQFCDFSNLSMPVFPMGKPSWLFLLNSRPVSWHFPLPTLHTPVPPVLTQVKKWAYFLFSLCLLMSPVPFCVPYYSNWECHHYCVTHRKWGGWGHSGPFHLPHPSPLITVSYPTFWS